MFRRVFIAALILLTLLLTPFSTAFAAVTYYWVGGTGSFSQTAHWSLSSGGASGVGPPGATDTAIWDSSSGGGTYTINGSPTVLVFQYTNINKTDVLQFSGGLTISALGTLSIQGASVTNRAYLNSSVLGTQRTITVPNTATVSLTNVDLQDIASAGTFGTWTGTSLGDALGNSGITFDASVSLTLASTGTINWSSATWTSSGAARTAPLPQDDVVINYSGASATTLTADMPRLGRNINFAGYTKTASFNSTSNTFFGNWAFGSSGTYSGSQALSAQGRGSQTITSATKSFPNSLLIQSIGGTYTAQDATSVANAFKPTSGTFNDGGFALSAYYFQGGGGISCVLVGSGAWSLSATGVVWVPFAPITVSLSGSISLVGTTSATTTFSGAGLSYPTLNWSNNASTGTLIITGANTFASLQSDNTTARTIQFPHGVTQTILPGGWKINGRPGGVISLTSDSAGLAATLATGATVKAKYLSIKDSTATGGPWCAANSTNVSGDSGWLFGTCSTTTKRAGRILSTQ